MVKFRVHLLCLALFFALSLAGCSSSNPIVITLSPLTPPVINAGQSQTITASLANDINNQGVTWSLTGPGTLTDYSSTSVTFVGPTDISIATTSTVTATSVASTTVTATLNITVNPVLAISTTSLPVGTVNTSYIGIVSAVGAVGSFTWSLTNGNLPAGLSLSQSTNSSVTIVGTPTTIGTSDFTIQVVDSSGVSVSRALSIKINPPPPLSVKTSSLPPGMVGALYGGSSAGVSLQAASGTPPYTWAVTGGNLPPGLSLSSAGAISGTPTTVGPYTFTVQVTDSTTPTPQTATATLSITINPSTAGNSKLSGNYAFLVSGFQGSKNFAAAGSFVADGNGNITAGLLDSNTPGNVQTSQTFTGSYAIGSNGLGTLSITAVGSPTFAVAVMADGSAKMIEFGNTTGSGVLLKQNTSAFSQSAIQGNYALGFLGIDAQGNRYGFAGALSADGAGHFTMGQLDSDDSATGSVATVAFSGTYSAPTAANGRGTATLTIGSEPVTNYSFYVVSSTQLLVMETDFVSGQGSPLVSGSILQQAPGSFTDSSLNGTSVLETTALSGSDTVAQVGLLTTGSGASSLSGYENNSSTTQPTSGNGTFSVSSNGRVTFLTPSGIASPDPVLYLVNTNQAFIVGTDTAVTFGFMEPQSGGPFTNSSLSGTYAGGSIAPVLSTATNQVDIAVADGVGGLSFTTDITSGTGLTQGQGSSGMCSSLTSTGQCTLMENGATTGYVFLVSPSEFYELYTNSNATVEDFQQ